MNTRSFAAAAFVASAVSAHAGGIDRSSQFLGPLFEEGGQTGKYLQFGLGRVSPSAEAPNLSISNPLGDYNSVSLAFKANITDQLSFALIIEEPYGADISYSLTSPFPNGGASVSSEQISALFRYKFNQNWSVIGGIRALQVDGFIDTFTITGAGLTPLSIEADSNFDFGSVVGIAYEKPEIALRVALSYNSGISSDFKGNETLFGDVGRTVPVASGPTEFTVDFPESFNLEFQTGIAADTLLFGSIRYAKYDGFNLTAPFNPALGIGPTQYVNFTSNATTYTIGLGRRFNEQWSGSVSYTFEDQGTVPSTTALAPTSGVQSIAVGAQYTSGIYSISGGITYFIPGDQLVNTPAGQASFDDNEGFGFGIRLGINF